MRTWSFTSGWMSSVMRVSNRVILAAMLALVPAWSLNATEELPDDEFLEFLGVWDEVWVEACDPEGSLSGDDACLEYEDDDEQESVDDEN